MPISQFHSANLTDHEAVHADLARAWNHVQPASENGFDIAVSKVQDAGAHKGQPEKTGKNGHTRDAGQCGRPVLAERSKNCPTTHQTVSSLGRSALGSKTEYSLPKTFVLVSGFLL